MKATFFEEMSPAIEWNELARKICKRNEDNKLTNQEVLDEIDETDDDYDDDTDDDDDDDSDEDDPDDEIIVEKKKEETPTKKPLPTQKVPAKSTPKPKPTPSHPPSIVDSDNENDESEADEEYDYDEKENPDDSEDREDESIVEDTSVEPDKNLLLEGIKAIKKVENRIFGKIKSMKLKLYLISILLGSDNEYDDDVVIEQATQYRFLWPMLIFMLSIFSVLLIIMFVIAQCMRRRGERYRQALLQSKNSIIYQKLSEEIAPQTPKVHRYTPIAQV